MGKKAGDWFMIFSSLNDFLAMGGYALFVWSAYLMTLAVFLYNVAAPIIGLRRVRSQILGQVRREAIQQSGAPRVARSQETKPGDVS